MDSNRWKAVNEIFHAALDLPPSERAGFVATVIGDDQELKGEVELLLEADANAGSYIETPLIAPGLLGNLAPPVNPGDILCGRFRVVREIAEGGMGHVFEAFDSELAVRVALKVIRPEISSDPEALARFRQEVRLARSITHPNVCRTFDLERETSIDSKSGISQDLVFLTMEFLEGETLAARIERTGALPLDDALEIARQMADALEAARRLGIVHRDMKPGNVMLVPEVRDECTSHRAVITDFGLARFDPLIASGNASALSHTARPIGTLAYMAPEQLEGTKVSSATDVYAFGLILFEMVTGKRAFPSDKFLSGIAQRLTGQALDPKALVPSLPDPWCRAIDGCLRTEPAERFTSAVDAFAVLEGRRARLPRSARRRTRGSQRKSRKLIWQVMYGLAVMALFAGVFRLYRSRADSKVAPGALVYLTEVQNKTGEKVLDNITELIRAGLAQSAQVNLLDQGRVGDILEQMTKPPDASIDASTAREIAMRAGAVRVVFASVTGSAGSYQLDIDIQQPDNTPTRYRDHWTKSFAWRASGATAANGAIPPELLTTVRNSSDWIRHEAGESANDIARLDVPPEDVTTGNWEALADYMKADPLARAQRFEDAVVILQDAVRLDPQFALAYARIGDLLLSLHRNSEGYHAYDEAMSLGLKSRLSRREEDRIRGMRAADTWDYQLAIDAFHDYEVYYKNDYLGWVYPTQPLHMMGRPEEVIANLRQAVAIDPSRSFAPEYLALESLVEGKNEEARKWITYQREHRLSGYADESEVSLAFVEHRYADAIRILSSMEASSDSSWRSDGFRMAASLEAERGEYGQALGFLNQAIEADAEEHSPASRTGMLLARAYIEMQLRDFVHCLRDVHEAIKLNPSPQTVLDADRVLGTAFVVSPAGFRGAIRDELTVAEGSLSSDSFGTISELAKLRTRGEILLSEGKSRSAVEVLEEAALKDAPAGSRDYLGRAYSILAEQETDSTRSRRFLAQAMTAYSAIAFHPAFVWWEPAEFPPGFYSSQLESWINVAHRLGAAGPELNHAIQEANFLRENAARDHRADSSRN